MYFIRCSGRVVNIENTDIGRIGKLLFKTSYNESFCSGSITVPGISQYRVYIGYFYAAQASPMIGFHTGNVIVFTGTLIAAESPFVARTTLIPSGDTVTFLNGEGIIQIYGLF